MANKKIWTVNLAKLKHNRFGFDLSLPEAVDLPTYLYLKTRMNDNEEAKQKYWDSHEKIVAIIELYRNNKPLSQPPDMLYTTFEVNKNIVLPPLFMISDRFILATEVFITILQRFRLGKTQIFPVHFYDLVLDEPVNMQTYYLLNVCEYQSYFIPELGGEKLAKTQKFPLQVEGKDRYLPPAEKNESKLYFFADTALNSPVDIWHEPSIHESIFISDALATALISAGLGKIPLLPCQLVILS